jgi:hypothetical protein
LPAWLDSSSNLLELYVSNGRRAERLPRMALFHLLLRVGF